MKFRLSWLLILALHPMQASAGCDVLLGGGRSPTDTAVTTIRAGAGAYGAPRDWKVFGNTHTGVDIVMNQSSSVPNAYQVSAIADGTVAYVRDNGAFGNLIVLDHGNGCYSLYAHLANKPFTPTEPGGNAFVKFKQRVTRGERIGYMRNLAGDTDSSGNAQKVGDLTARTQTHFALFEAPAGRSSTGTLKPDLLPGDSAYVDPTPFLEGVGYRAN